MVLLEYIERHPGGLLEVLQDVGFDVPLDASGLVALVSPFLDPARDVAGQSVERGDLPHIDFVPPGLPPADEEDTDAPVFIQDGRERPDVKILADDEPVPGAVGEEQRQPETFPGAREQRESGVVEGPEVLGAEGADLLQVKGQRSLLLPAEVHGLEARLALAEDLLERDGDLFL